MTDGMLRKMSCTELFLWVAFGGGRVLEAVESELDRRARLARERRLGVAPERLGHAPAARHSARIALAA